MSSFLTFLTVCPLTVVATVSIDNELGGRPVPHYTAGGQTTEVDPALDSHYGYLIVNEIPDAARRREIELHCPVRFLAVHTMVEGNVVYRVRFTGAIASLRRALPRTVPGFYNLEPILPEDKTTRAIDLGWGFPARTSDARSGRVYATVLFNEGVTAQAADSIVSFYADSVVHLESDRGFAIFSPTLLRQLTYVPEIRRVYETDPTPPLQTAIGRQLIRADSAQSFNVSAISFPPSDTTTWATANRLTGEGIRIGVYDTGTDSLQLDFLQVDTGSGDTLARRALRDSIDWLYPNDVDGHLTMMQSTDTCLCITPVVQRTSTGPPPAGAPTALGARLFSRQYVAEDPEDRFDALRLRQRRWSRLRSCLLLNGRFRRAVRRPHACIQQRGRVIGVCRVR